MANTPKIRFKGFTEDWEQRKLEDVVEFLDTMRKPLEGAKRTPGPYPYYGASGIVDYVDGYLFDEELVLLSEDGANITDRNYPVCFLASGKYWVNNHAHVLRTKDGNENNFICNSLERKDYKQYNSGMAMPKLNQEVCRSIPISCPSFDEQKKIGDYFRNLDNLITLHQCKCDETKELKKYMLQKMFPKNGERVPKIRFAGFTDDWEQRKLGESLSFLKDGTHGTHADAVDGPLLLSAKNIKDGTVKWDESDRRISQEEYEKIHSNFSLKTGDVLLTIVGSIGEAAILKDYEGVTFQRSVAFLRPKDDILSDFLYTEIQTPTFQKELESRKSTSAQPGIYLGDLAEIPLQYSPSLDEQKKIGEYFSYLDNLITLHQRKCDDLKEVKKYMLQNMFPEK